MNKVYLYVDIKMKKAVHIYKSNNFEIEGTLKEHFYTRGEYRDCYVMGLLKRIGLINMTMIYLILGRSVALGE